MIFISLFSNLLSYCYDGLNLFLFILLYMISVSIYAVK